MCEISAREKRNRPEEEGEKRRKTRGSSAQMTCKRPRKWNHFLGVKHLITIYGNENDLKASEGLGANFAIFRARSALCADGPPAACAAVDGLVCARVHAFKEHKRVIIYAFLAF